MTRRKDDIREQFVCFLDRVFVGARPGKRRALSRALRRRDGRQRVP